jgi:hypothetical protein
VATTRNRACWLMGFLYLIVANSYMIVRVAFGAGYPRLVRSLSCSYSPECVEGVFSDDHIQELVYLSLNSPWTGF